MAKLQVACSETTEAFLASAGPELASLCTACGACFSVCPMVDHMGLRHGGYAASQRKRKLVDYLGIKLAAA